MSVIIYGIGAIIGATIGYIIGSNWTFRKHLIPMMGTMLKALTDNNRALDDVSRHLEHLQLINPEDLKELNEEEGFALPEEEEEEEGEEVTITFQMPDMIVTQYDQSGTLIYKKIVDAVVKRT